MGFQYQSWVLLAIKDFHWQLWLLGDLGVYIDNYGFLLAINNFYWPLWVSIGNYEFLLISTGCYRYL